VIVRASAIGSLTPAGTAAMREHGVRTIIDLRWPEEIATQPSPFASGVAYRNVPFDEPKVMRLYHHAVAGTMAEQLAALAPAASGLRAVIAAMAESEPAIVVHCQAGRDRTGAVIGLLLAAIGVADEDVVADYCLSDNELVPEYERLVREHPETAADIAEQRARRGWVMGALLAAVRSEYGDAREYLRVAGVAPSQLTRLRDMLVESSGA
jgi:protein tyrosine/serine phosphatase